MNYEKKLCVYSISLYRVCYYFFLQIIEQTSEKQNDFKQNFLYSKKTQKENFKKTYYSTYVFNNQWSTEPKQDSVIFGFRSGSVQFVSVFSGKPNRISTG